MSKWVVIEKDDWLFLRAGGGLGPPMAMLGLKTGEFVRCHPIADEDLAYASMCLYLWALGKVIGINDPTMEDIYRWAKEKAE